MLVTERLIQRLDFPATCASFARFLRVDPTKADPRFIFWYLQNLYSTGQMAQHQVQHTGVARFQYTRFAETQRVPLPPRDQQRSIAELLGALDDKIEANNRCVHIGEQLLRAHFDKLFIVHEGSSGEGIVLGDILESVRDIVQPGNIDPTTPYVGLEHIPRGSVVLRETGAAAEVTSGKFSFAPGDILFGKLRPYFRKVVIAQKVGICSSDILVLRAFEARWLPFALMLTSSQPFIDFCDAASTGTRMPRVNWQDMASYPIGNPDVTVSRAFNQLAVEMLERLHAAVVESRALRLLREALLSHLLSGALRVHSTEVRVGEAV
jgi:type I restriction enzyme S subunit